VTGPRTAREHPTHHYGPPPPPPVNRTPRAQFGTSHQPANETSPAHEKQLHVQQVRGTDLRGAHDLLPRSASATPASGCGIIGEMLIRTPRTPIVMPASEGRIRRVSFVEMARCRGVFIAGSKLIPWHSNMQHCETYALGCDEHEALKAEAARIVRYSAKAVQRGLV